MITIGTRVQVVAPNDRPTVGRTGAVIQGMFLPDTWLVKPDSKFGTRQTYVYHEDELEEVK